MLLIDRLSLDFAPGLNVLTGETGAGKSILLDCLGFVLGWRGRAELVRAGAAQGEVTAVFDLPPGHPESLVAWDAVAGLRGTLVLMMAVERVEVFADALLEGGRRPDTPVAMIENGSLPTQRLLRTDLAHAGEVAEAEGLRPPAIVVIGDVAAFTEGA